ncbi:MAG: DUF3048 domain-containing protein, partial [Actinomycetota bacterium]|nr:DUF3048 domain-containing protein [Actinomycetota bacterium]
SGSGGDEAGAAVTAGTPDSTAVAGGEVTAPVVAPLTGIVDESAATAERPALSVKIDNAPRARPQAGLDVADLVFEEVVEGGVTRFIAVFHSTAPDEVGPVRSVRPMDPRIVSALGGLVAYSGGIPEYVAMMGKARVQDLNIDVATSAYRWAKERAKPHNLMVHPGELWPMATEKHSDPPPAQFDYRAPGEAFGDADAASLRIPYSNFASAAYAWDAPSGTWKRSQDGAAHMAASGAQIAPHNLVVQFVSTRKLGKVDASGHAVNESIVTGDGDAWVLSGGRVTKGRWSKPDATSPTRYTDGAGNPVKLSPGRTWVHFAPRGAAVSTS